jgi:hypothetical protein
LLLGYLQGGWTGTELHGPREPLLLLSTAVRDATAMESAGALAPLPPHSPPTPLPPWLPLGEPTRAQGAHLLAVCQPQILAPLRHLLLQLLPDATRPATVKSRRCFQRLLEYCPRLSLSLSLSLSMMLHFNSPPPRAAHRLVRSRSAPQPPSATNGRPAAPHFRVGGASTCSVLGRPGIFWSAETSTSPSSVLDIFPTIVAEE